MVKNMFAVATIAVFSVFSVLAMEMRLFLN